MTSTQFVFWLTCLFLGETVHLTWSTSVEQERGFISADVGENVTLQCFYKGSDSAWLFWYIQTLGQKPRLISEFYVFDTKYTLKNEFHNNPRFTLDINKPLNHLKISEVKLSDSATYYCAASYAAVLTFAEGATLRVKDSGSGIPASVHQPESETIQPGGSKTLSCTVHTGTCDGEHSVYWFRDSGESHPGLVYSGGGRNDQCERNPNTQTHTCVYSLPMNVSSPGTFYCAVTACGNVMFGNGTEVTVARDENFVLVYILAGALMFTTTTVVLLSFFLYKMIRRRSCQSTESRFPAPPTTSTAGNGEDPDSVHYAALHVNQTNSSRRQRNSCKTECVYSSVRQ
ncbi:immunoglobulin kappa light chain-like [Melanotaenia boesemani]|uniref:immunoglobulin kappa light chain-like n=1 Tax=Melanotaenia boesemani TaxID=1250792 RepID=UPI001C03FFD0|nr:immunoglobulin kappa light chain-like [Melanotaenia boesemani]